MASTGEPRGLGRRPALDGLRGIAALVVVVHHVFFLDPALADRYGGYHPERVPWLLGTSPLRLIWAGEVAVAVFFVLSGYVLARTYLHGPGQRWRDFYPRRLLRLYLPAWAALALALAILNLIERPAYTGRSWWADQQHVNPTLRSILDDAVMWHQPDNLDGVLWTLRWEIIFSVTLPLYVAVARYLRRYPLGVVLTALLVLNLVGDRLAVYGFSTNSLRYLPVFAVGVLLADREATMTAWIRRIGPPGCWLVLGVSILLMTHPLYTVEVLGAGLLVMLVPAMSTIDRGLTGGLPLWLGRHSYSLYLVHLPVVLALSALVPWRTWLLLPVAIGLSLCCAWAFFTVVEAPLLHVLRGRRAASPSLVVDGLDVLGSGASPRSGGARSELDV